jgi:hypothetical protein
MRVLDIISVQRIVTGVRLQQVSQEPRERKCEKGLLLTGRSNRVESKFVASPHGCLSTERHAQLVP